VRDFPSKRSWKPSLISARERRLGVFGDFIRSSI
jgi:hypothetical protein